MFSMWPCTWNLLGWCSSVQTSQWIPLEQTTGFKLLEQSNKHSQKNRIYLLTAPCLWLGRWFDWSNWVAISSLRIYWLFHVSDWVDGLIGPTGLLLVVSHLFAVPVQFQFFYWIVQGPILWVGGDDGCSEEASKAPTWLPGTENQTKLGNRPKLDQTNTTSGLVGVLDTIVDTLHKPIYTILMILMKVCGFPISGT
jgi:hypothetical protein